MRRIALVVPCLCVLALACRTPEPLAPLAKEASARAIAQGELVGRVGLHGGHAWLGVPFAAPPVGELRWRAPQPPHSWEGRREALAPGARCPQLASRLEGSARPGEIIGT